MREPQTPIAAVPAQPQPTSVSSVRQAHGPSLSRAVEPQKEVAKSLDEKLSDYYGVNQINDAVMFVSLYPHAKEVHIAGDFNNWHPAKTKMNKVGSSGIWQTKMQIGPGRYRYRLVVDGKWQQDPYNEMIEMNPYGEMNSILEVK
jgi:1,4-alpha-glucan branching enzyme